MKTLILVVVMFCQVSIAQAVTPEAYPGSFWGTGFYDFDKFEGLGTQGNFTQGVQWLTLPGEIPLTTYGSMRWRLREHKREFYNAQGPAIGVALNKWFLNLGFEYEWQTFPLLQTTSSNPALFLTWYKKVYLLGGDSPTFFGMPIVGYPTSTWGRLNYDFDSIEGAASMGFVTQAIEWMKVPGDFVFRTQATYTWRVRSKNTRFYNSHGPSAGIELNRSDVSLGIEYGVQHYNELNQDISRFQLYLNWYLDWDLKSKSP